MYIAISKAAAAAFIVAAAAAPVAVAASAHAAPTSVKYYENCTAAREDGAAPIQKGQDGYGDHLDRDGDGIACE
ncbi:MAG: excalibur calcium-binding domain-containing protein [Gordonia sp. (in: high G+C Gram-positive bacteria)]|uniref:excalibur calcium-binding domain-containing protein n=1 Tax=Gordonia sp. (in: high G+C Gram-positive bacteria) TaxID=84139 RepID=UPI0039E5E585